MRRYEVYMHLYLHYAVLKKKPSVYIIFATFVMDCQLLDHGHN